MTEPFLRFEILEKLGHGGMGIVYRVRDTERKAEVALKTLHEFDPNYLQNFKQEFRIAANIVHPNLVTLYELFCDQAKWFFTMELIRGSSFSSFTGVEISEDDEPLNEPIADGLETRLFALRKVFPQVVTGIGRLHQDGIIHRDLKPNNVLVTDTGRVVILDFGIAVTKLTKPSPHSLEKKITGTIDYMPPEAITGAEPQPQSDWYSLGVMLYQCLTGRLPYAGDTARILYEKVSKDPIAPHEFLPGIPEAWSSLCLTLLKRDPNERPDYRSLLAMIAANPELGFAPDSLSFEEPANLFIGRQSEIDLLTAKLNEVKSGSPAALLVGGKSGVGKSTLIERFLDSVASSEGACVLTGRCYQQEMVPFKALDSLVDSVARYLAHTTDTRLVPQDVQALVSAFPVLRKVEIFYDAVCLQSEVTDRQEINRRAATALAELIGKLAAKQIVALYIDNLQWGDTESAELLYRLLRSIEGARVLFIGSYRQEDEGAAPLFKKLDELIEQRGAIAYLERHTIGALSFEQSVDLALQLLGDTG
ncbi:MAG TPA: serine/threonine-protein kinase, partial [Oligoflexia bacterium]|nr:serine/threonine-protein kinase [Oligoflexia bacterium]